MVIVTVALDDGPLRLASTDNVRVASAKLPCVASPVKDSSAVTSLADARVDRPVVGSLTDVSRFVARTASAETTVLMPKVVTSSQLDQLTSRAEIGRYCPRA